MFIEKEKLNWNIFSGSNIKLKSTFSKYQFYIDKENFEVRIYEPFIHDYEIYDNLILENKFSNLEEAKVFCEEYKLKIIQYKQNDNLN